MKPMYRVANCRSDREVGPGSKREAGCENVGRERFSEVLWEVMVLSIDWWSVVEVVMLDVGNVVSFELAFSLYFAVKKRNW